MQRHWFLQLFQVLLVTHYILPRENDREWNKGTFIKYWMLSSKRTFSPIGLTQNMLFGRVIFIDPGFFCSCFSSFRLAVMAVSQDISVYLCPVTAESIKKLNKQKMNILIVVIVTHFHFFPPSSRVSLSQNLEVATTISPTIIRHVIFKVSVV